MIRALVMELQRWHNSRAVVCDTCGRRLVAGRRRANIAYWIRDNHELTHTGHVVKVKRFG